VVSARTASRKSQKRGRKWGFDANMMNSHTISPHGNGSVSSGNGTASVPMTVTPLTITQGDDDSELDSIMQDIFSDEENWDQDDLVEKIRALQVIVTKMMKRNDELRREVGELRESAESVARETSHMILARAQDQNYVRDARTYRKINALVLDKIFSFKKFVVSQRDLDDFTGNSSLGMVIMNILKVQKPDRLPFWNAYKEIVADAIANRRTTITNDLKKIVMSKYSRAKYIGVGHQCTIAGQRNSH
jgi:FtsZ-binding cell division protein ZapB